MLWSMIKILLFGAIVAALTYAATYLIENGEAVQLTVANTEFTLSPLAAVVVALLISVAIWLIFKLAGLTLAVIRFLNGDETAISRFFNRNREKKGYRALADGMLALASGEGRTALTKATQAERYLARPELTALLTAQAAEMVGDKSRATKAYKTLIEDDRTRFVGVRGILKQKLVDGDTETALKLAEKAFALRPRHSETQDTLLQLQAGEEDWKGARKTLNAKLKYGGLPRDVHKRRDAVLAYSEALDALTAEDMEKASAKAMEANKQSPTLVPAAALAARTLIRDGKTRQATRILRKAWHEAPHPELAAAFAEIVPDETPSERLARFQQLVRVHPDDVETQLLKAELNIAAEDFPAARKALGDLFETAPNARSLTLMAAVEKGSGADDAAVRGWLARAVTASRGPQWVCDSCNNIHGSWVPVCTNCNGFDTLSWREPPQAETSLTNSAEMLPLIVGAIEDQNAEVEDPAVVVETGEEPVSEAEAPGDELEPPTGTAEAAEVIELEPLKHEAPPAEAEEEVENRASAT